MAGATHDEASRIAVGNVTAPHHEAANSDVERPLRRKSVPQSASAPVSRQRNAVLLAIVMMEAVHVS